MNPKSKVKIHDVEPLEKTLESHKPATIAVGSFYVRPEDVWAIDSTNPDFIQVYARDQIFKIKPELFRKLEI